MKVANQACARPATVVELTILNKICVSYMASDFKQRDSVKQP